MLLPKISSKKWSWDDCYEPKMTFFPLILLFFSSKRISLCIENVQKNIAFTILLLTYIQQTWLTCSLHKAQERDSQKLRTRIFLFSRSTEHPSLPCYRSAGFRGAQHLFCFGKQLGSSVKPRLRSCSQFVLEDIETSAHVLRKRKKYRELYVFMLIVCDKPRICVPAFLQWHTWAHGCSLSTRNVTFFTWTC